MTTNTAVKGISSEIGLMQISNSIFPEPKLSSLQATTKPYNRLNLFTIFHWLSSYPIFISIKPSLNMLTSTFLPQDMAYLPVDPF